MSEDAAEDAALVAMLRTLPKGHRWAEVIERILEAGSAMAAWSRETEDVLIPDPGHADAHDQALRDVAEWRSRNWRFLGFTDAEYPERVREIHQAPPFLFAAGNVRADDPAVAVVGSRKASSRGLSIATSVATRLAGDGITVLSGLAEGIDTAAHTAALAAGGRTVAVIGTGIAKYYPASNRPLQDEIAKTGLVLSQFWPEGPVQKHNFLMRNAVMSGYSRATVVVEAGENSGARAQARMAVEHGRPVILTDQVVSANEWAQALVDRPGVFVATGLAEVMSRVHEVLDRDTAADKLLGELAGAGL
ncbi:MAG: DNA-processing protein DprA [Nocardioidaceae bacterium]